LILQQVEHLSIQIKVAANPIRTAEFRKGLNADGGKF
jgi:hypothetical protein